MGLYRTKAIVVGHRNLGEADKILTLFSPERGKIHTTARGVRRPRNRLVGGTQIFTYSNFLILEGKNLDNISQCEIIESFYKIRGTLDKMAYGLYFAELLRASTPMEDKNRKLFNFFLKTLYILQEWKDMEILSRVFEIKLLAIQGFSPELNRCTLCGSNDKDDLKFSPSIGGIICKKCKTQGQAIPISIETLFALRKMLVSTYEELNGLQLNQEVKKQLSSCLIHFIKEHFDRPFKTLDFIDDIRALNKRTKKSF